MDSLTVRRWIPIRNGSGIARTISIPDLADPTDPPVGMNSPRADFNGALAQFLIGVLQLVAPPEDDETWLEYLHKPPSPADLAGALTRWSEFFRPSGDQPFMQDAALDIGTLPCRPVTALLLESPGDNALVNNTDLFIKRSSVPALSAETAITALLTLQINAPPGGQGYRTSVRGGGPLTTLIWPDEIYAPGSRAPVATTLWQKLWLNVQARRTEPADPGVVLPWAGPCRTSEGGRTVFDGMPRALTPIESDCLALFASPRRIRLLWDGEGESQECIGFVTQNYGANYPSHLFRHPLSPYYRDKDDRWLPLHIGPSGFGYRDFASLCVASADPNANRRVARAVEAATTRQVRRRVLIPGRPATWAFGYAMDNMKVLAWHEERYPLFEHESEAVRTVVANESVLLVTAADAAARLLAQSVRKLGADADLVLRSWRAATEQQFYTTLQNCLVDPELSARREARRAWRRHLFASALRLFEQFAERDVATQSKLRSVEQATAEQRSLLRKLGAALDDALDLKPPTPRVAKEPA